MSLPYFQMYAKEWTSSETVRLMSFAEKGLYIDLLNYSWTNDGLPADTLKIARMVGAGAEEFAEIWPGVEPSFPVAEDGRRRNPRQEQERQVAVGKTEHGKAGANARWKNKPKSVPGNAPAMPEHQAGIDRAMPRAYGSGSVSGSEKGSAEGKVREFPKPAPGPVESEPAAGVSVTGWTQAGFESPEAGEMWFQALVVKHPNRKGNTAARTAFLDRVLIGQFNRTEFERWYEEQVPIWQKWPMFPNLHSIFVDGEWRFPKVQPAAVNYNDPKRYELGD